ncbi:hypothetical protein [Clostridium sp. 1001283B150210_160208_E6]|uniref:hypothetical protein n=1 Tax=Clostridium sp. 1001283B150210_160208_E6 TaxID=2787129 RepID=UPI0018AA0E42|nr:hypothetical protein [Clostridium sp. 1001283B150210_160208_E6]
MIKQQFINKVIDELERKVINKQYDIPFIIAPLEQRLDECTELLEDLKNHGYYIDTENIDEEDYWTYAKLRIGFYDIEDDEDDCNYLNFTYKIDFIRDERNWGYCTCSEDDEDYDARHKCCGHGCDWSAPSFTIRKEYYTGNYSWNGDEHDYWDFEDKFYNVTLEEKEDLQKKTQIKSLEEQIKTLTEKLHKLQG